MKRLLKDNNLLAILALCVVIIVVILSVLLKKKDPEVKVKPPPTTERIMTADKAGPDFKMGRKASFFGGQGFIVGPWRVEVFTDKENKIYMIMNNREGRAVSGTRGNNFIFESSQTGTQTFQAIKEGIWFINNKKSITYPLDVKFKGKINFKDFETNFKIQAPVQNFKTEDIFRKDFNLKSKK